MLTLVLVLEILGCDVNIIVSRKDNGESTVHAPTMLAATYCCAISSADEA